ncbi:MAG TPA: type II secretion system F family protein, partial [Methanocorpusculum sp.]|nr:type II secretion system F family protein [Methanocorpusculum sp.]
SAVVYGILPLGTLGFLLALDILYPQPPKPKKEISGVTYTPSPSDKTEKQILRRVSAYEKRKKYRDFMRSPADALIRRPYLIFIISIPTGAVVSAGLLMKNLMPVGTAAAAGLLITLFPYAVFSHLRSRRISAVESGIPSVCRILSSAAGRGLTISKGLSEAASNIHGILGRELSAAVRDIQFGGGVYESLGRLRDRLQIPSADKLMPLIQEASKHSADMSYPFSLCADEAAASAERAAQRKSSMQLYVMIMYISYAVFIFVQFILTGVFIDSFAASGNGVNTDMFSRILADAVLIHGVCCGLAAGKLSGSGISGGILHACILLSVGTAASVVMIIL